MHPDNLPKTDKQPISTAPKDGTIILGYWQDDPDPRPQQVRWSNGRGTWTLAEPIYNDYNCEPPTHWSPIT